MEQKSRKAIPKRVRAEVYNRDKATCRYCGAVGVRFQLDHLDPYSKGGEDTLENLLLACGWCNRQKWTGRKEPNPPPSEWPEGYSPIPLVELPRRGTKHAPEKRQFVGLKISPQGRAAIQRYADRKGITWSEAARRALAEGLQHLR